MKTIEKISRQKEFYLLHFNDETKLLVSEDQLVTHRLLKGQEVSDELYEKLQEDLQQQLGLNLAYGYLSYGLKTELEIFRYLKEKEIAIADRKKIIEKLKELDLINDLFYGKSYVRTQMNLSDKGPLVLKDKLREKGLKPEEIQEALREFSPDKILENAKKLGVSYWKKQQRVAYQKRIQKLKQHLLQKGFPKDVISEVLETLPLADENNEDELLKKALKKALRQYASEADKGKRKQKIIAKLYREGFSLSLIQRALADLQEEDFDV